MRTLKSTLPGLTLLFLAACGQAPDTAAPAGTTAAAPPVPASTFAQVTEDRLRNADADPGQWMSASRAWNDAPFSFM